MNRCTERKHSRNQGTTSALWALAILPLLWAGCANDPVAAPPPPPTPPKPVIAYYDGANQHAKMATKEADDSWTIETIDESDAGQFITLVFDGSGVPHLAYKDFASVGFRVKYARKIAGNWQKEVVDFGGDVGDWTSLALDSKGSPHIGYIDRNTPRVMYAFKTGTTWVTEVVDALPQSGGSLVIAVDSGGVPRIAYTSGANTKFAVRAGVNDWDAEIASTRRHDGAETRLAMVIDNQDVPHIGFYSISDGFFRVSKPAAVWIEESIDPNGILAGQYASFVLDRQGKLRAAYGEFATSALRYGENDGLTWDLDVAVFNGAQVVGMSLGLDKNGTPYVSYRDKLVAGRLRMVVRNANGTWSNESVDPTPEVASFTSIVVR